MIEVCLDKLKLGSRVIEKDINDDIPFKWVECNIMQTLVSH